ncbi:MAG: hypothetical protein K5751_02055, partial [Treponemataceae bacterium]|nr:hypothetical protein [Treponemataceae bacterium]
RELRSECVFFVVVFFFFGNYSFCLFRGQATSLAAQDLNTSVETGAPPSNCFEQNTFCNLIEYTQVLDKRQEDFYWYCSRYIGSVRQLVRNKNESLIFLDLFCAYVFSPD